MPVLKVILDKIIVETSNVKTYRLKWKDPSTKFDFKAGQFVMLAVPCIKDGKEQIIRRAYSIASPPNQTDSIDLTMKKAGLVTSKMDSLVGGEELEISGPFGTFLYMDGMSSKVMFLAAGAGIAPIWGIMRYINEKKLPVDMTLLFSSMTPPDLIYPEDLPRMMRENPRLKAVLTVTRPHESKPEDLASWTGEHGRVDKEKIKRLIDERKPELFYICGVPEMVNDCVKHLKELGVEPSRIKTERF